MKIMISCFRGGFRFFALFVCARAKRTAPQILNKYVIK